MSTRYEEPKEGHYYQAVAKGRMSKLQELAVAPPPAPLRTWADDYCDWLLSPSGECIVSKKGRDAVEALRAKLKLTNVPVDAATRAVRDDEGAREALRRLGRANGPPAPAAQGLQRAPAARLEPGRVDLGQAANAPRRRTSHIAKPNVVPAGGAVRAQHAAPQRKPGDDRSSDVVDVAVGAKRFGGGAELLEPFTCRLHVPGWMKNRLRTDAQRVNIAGLAVRWMFTCSYGGAQKVTVRLNRDCAMAPLKRESGSAQGASLQGHGRRDPRDRGRSEGC